MLQAPRDEPTLKTFAALRETTEGQVLHNWLAGELQRLRRENQSQRDEVATRWGQGAIQAVDDILEMLDNARGNAGLIQTAGQARPWQQVILPGLNTPQTAASPWPGAGEYNTPWGNQPAVLFAVFSTRPSPPPEQEPGGNSALELPTGNAVLCH